MQQISLRTVFLGAAIYVLLDVLWLTAATSTSVPDGARPVLKTLCLIAALGAYIVIAGVLATQAEGSWVLRTALNSAAAVLIALAVMIGVSLIWYRGQFFHDAEPVSQIPSLLLLLATGTLVSGALALLPGVAARLILRTAA